MFDEKKSFLSSYLLQNAVIHRCNLMMECYPEKREEYLQEIEAANALRNEIEAKIRQIDDTTLSELLMLKYVCGKTLMEISFLMNYSVRQIERLHKKALEKFKL